MSSDLDRRRVAPAPARGRRSAPGTQVAFLRAFHPTADTARAVYVVAADGSRERLVGFGTRVPAWQPYGVAP